jgi:sensor histidine kinase YesM
VENALKYAISRSESGGTIQITARVIDASLEISVDDSGADSDDIHISDTEPLTNAGIGLGLQNTRERLKTCFGSRAYCRPARSPLGGRRVEICIPAEEAA